MQAIHKKSGNTYRIISENHKVQIDGHWYDAVLYGIDGADKDTPTFTRIVEDFNRKFVRVKPKVGKRQDGVQLNRSYEG